MTHTRRADEVILSADAHTAVHESGGAAALSGVLLRTLHFDGYMPDKARIAAAVRPDDLHCPRTGVILLENPLSAGRVVPLDTMREIYDFARDKGIPLHLDGARIFNAAAALGCAASDIAQYADSVMFCLSKGLCAPIGSILAGSKDFIKQALRNRKMLGGGMRQTGVLAAPGLIALLEMPRRLPEDHRQRFLLAERLDAIDGVWFLREQLDINWYSPGFPMRRGCSDAFPNARRAGCF
jgi:threonine aldolase